MSQSGTLKSGGAPGTVTSLTPNEGSAIAGPNINVLGYPYSTTPVTWTVNNAGNFEVENRVWSTPYVVDSSTTVGKRGTYSTIQAAINACFADGNASSGAVGYIKIRGKGGSTFYTENLSFPASSLFYLEGDTTFSPTVGSINVIVLGIHTLGASSGIYASNVYFSSNSGTLTAFNFSSGNSGCFMNCGLSFNNTGATVQLEGCILTIGGTQSGGTLTAYNTQLNSMAVSGGTQTFTNCLNPQFTLSGSGAPVCINCTTTANGTSWTGTTSGTPAILGGQMPATYAYTGNIRVAGLSEYSGTTSGDFFGSNIVQSMARAIQGNVLIQRRVSGSSTISNKDYYVGITSTAAAYTMTLPSTASTTLRPYKGQIFIFKDESGAAATNNITIATNGGTIDGSSTATISNNYGGLIICYDGTNYETISKYPGGVLSGTGAQYSLPRYANSTGQLLEDSGWQVNSSSQLVSPISGTATIPAFSLKNDVNGLKTGFYYTGTGQWAFSSAGTQSCIMDSTSFQWNAQIRSYVTDLTTNSASLTFVQQHTLTSGTAANGIGCRFRTNLPDDSGSIRSAGDIITEYQVVATATRKARHRFYCDSAGTLTETFNTGLYQSRFFQGIAFNRTATATNYNVLVTDYLVAVTDTSAARTITLPNPGATGMVTGQQFIIKDESLAAATNNITINVSGGVNIDGATSQTISANGGSITVYSNGTAYFIL